MKRWRELDLRKSETRPEEGRLFVMRVEPKSGGPFARVEHRVGTLKKADPQSDKLWFAEGTGSVLDPAKLKERNKLYWIYVEPFDA